eukprot:SAG31_NODE_18832_length_621_cov_1.030651_1_plen_109_part_01
MGGGAAVAKHGGKTRSALHVDDLDNLYVLLCGRKRVRLFCPADAHAMHMHGPVRCVRPCGFSELGRARDGRQPNFSRLDLSLADDVVGEATGAGTSPNLISILSYLNLI